MAFFASKYFQTRNKENVAMTTQGLVLNKAKLQFSFPEHNFSNLKQNEEATVYFVYENKSGNPLKIQNISSRCGCTIPVWSRKELLPNQKDSILVKYDSKEMGYFSKDIYVVSNSETSPDVLYITGTVIK